MWQSENSGRTPNWLRALERRIQWLAIPNIAILLVTLQVLGALLVYSDDIWVGRLALWPEAVRAGQLWRLVTYLALPLNTSPIFLLLTLWFLYYVVNAIESEWGAFKTTLYTLTSVAVTIAFSFIFDFPVTSISHFESSLFLAAAALFPDEEVLLFLIVPVKFKWMAWLTGAWIVLEAVQSSWLDRLFLVAIYSNFLIFFGPALLSRIRNWNRRKKFERSMRD